MDTVLAKGKTCVIPRCIERKVYYILLKKPVRICVTTTPNARHT